MHPTSSVISIDNLSFGYARGQLVLDRLQLEVPAGAIYGFLGANGAGKSTTIRAILGLLKPQKGAIRLFDKDVQQHRLEVLRKTGSLIEAPSIYLHLSGYDNLRIVCAYLGLPKRRIDEVLELVNLSKHSRKISKKYSTGMKQRLGMAMALLSDPDLLILDEPTNGLDPTGIIEIRTVLQQLQAQGKTIFLSSHLLAEIERIATHVGIIKHGTILFQGTIQALEQLRKGKEKLRIVTPQTEQAIELLHSSTEIRKAGEGALEVVLTEAQAVPAMIRELVMQGIDIHEVSRHKHDLEQLFIDLTEN